MTLLHGNRSEPDTEPDTLWEMTSYLINRISHRYNHNVQSELKALGLTTLNARIIVCLKVYGQLTVNELSIHAIAEQPTMSRALDRMEDDGLISRVAGEQDSRSRVAGLTAKGKAMYLRIMPIMAGANEHLLAGLKAEDQTRLMALLTQVLKQLRKNPI